MLKSLKKLTLAQNLIEKIENLGELTNLIELDLSFNKITKIENLEQLANLEVLSLFHNKIKKLENFEMLENLLIFSIGDNLIEDYMETVSPRVDVVPKTPGCTGPYPCRLGPGWQTPSPLYDQSDTVDTSIPDKDREMGVMKFRSELREFNEEYEEFEKKRTAREMYVAKNELYALAFVEYLEGPDLFDTMFEKDPDGTLLLKIGGELLHHYAQYKEQYVEAMIVLVEFGQKSYGEREKEIKMFKEVIDNALEHNIKRSKMVVEEFENEKKPLTSKLNALIEQVTSKAVSVFEIDSTLIELGENFGKIVYNLWKNLMSIEIQLFEQCEETRVQLGVNLSEKIAKLLEVSRNAFGQWRELESTWSMSQFDIVSRLLGIKLTLFEDTSALMEVLSDRDVMMNVIAQSNDSHMRFIDLREDTLTTRANHWKDDLIQQTNNNEIKRNRDRILEINYYIDNQRQEWEDMQLILSEAPDAEVVALLGEEC
ncbi:Dynein regulatory complex subunit 3 [Eumeta japonica]|uniref:Dynein axonemal assembly factor 1 homolog n=1 Tax=Eumeta variegata TaxID=151549 RepID=A0A4C1YYA8_EUMVA|nr:Dynein regulatory complex subunit 3 [Eumeta japonica]